MHLSFSFSSAWHAFLLLFCPSALQGCCFFHSPPPLDHTGADMLNRLMRSCRIINTVWGFMYIKYFVYRGISYHPAKHSFTQRRNVAWPFMKCLVFECIGRSTFVAEFNKMTSLFLVVLPWIEFEYSVDLIKLPCNLSVQNQGHH